MCLTLAGDLSNQLHYWSSMYPAVPFLDFKAINLGTVKKQKTQK